MLQESGRALFRQPHTVQRVGEIQTGRNQGRAASISAHINEVPAMRNTQGRRYPFVIDGEFARSIIDATLGNDAE